MIEDKKAADRYGNEPVDFWQMVEDAGYLIEGEKRGYEREMMKSLAQSLSAWLDAHPEIKSGLGCPLDHFAMWAVYHLASAFAFNDACGADRSDFKERLHDTVVSAVGGEEAFQDMCDDDEPTSKH